MIRILRLAITSFAKMIVSSTRPAVVYFDFDTRLYTNQSTLRTAVFTLWCGISSFIILLGQNVRTRRLKVLPLIKAGGKEFDQDLRSLRVKMKRNFLARDYAVRDRKVWLYVRDSVMHIVCSEDAKVLIYVCLLVRVREDLIFSFILQVW